MKTVAIVGSHRETRELAPWDDPNVEIWAFNEAYSQKIHGDDGEPYQWCKRADVVFQLHDPVVYQSVNNRSDRHHWEWLQAEHENLRIYMQYHDDLIPNSVKLQMDELQGLLVRFRQGVDLQPRSYFTSSIAIAIALAVLQNYEHILIYGVNMGSETEYHFQRECVTFWLGYALGAGLKVDMVSGDDIFDRPVYGYEGYIYVDVLAMQTRADKLKADLANLRESNRAIEDMMADTWQSKQIGEYITQAASGQTQKGILEGQLFELDRYLFKADEMTGKQGFAYIDRNEYEMAAGHAQKEQLIAGPNVYRTVGHVDLALMSWQFTSEPAHLKQLQAYVDEHLKAAYRSGYLQGIFDENRRLAFEMDKYLKAAGGIKTVQSVLDVHV